MRALMMEFKALQREPVEGFRVTVPNEGDFYTWQVAIFGPPETPYEGGYFKVMSSHVALGLSLPSPTLAHTTNPLTHSPPSPLGSRRQR